MTHTGFAQTASLIGDPSRAAMLLQLMDGRALPAGELARRARISPQTASAHLGKLVAGGLLALETHGRHRYYRLRGPEVAQALEGLLILSPPGPVRSLRESEERKALRFARTCYDHLAGRVGVRLAEQLTHRGWLTRLDAPSAAGKWELTPAGEEALAAFGLDIPALRRSRRSFARPCLDWMERRHHLAGALGAALTARLFELGWLRRHPSSRAVILTEAGRTGLHDAFGVSPDTDENGRES
ncbi:ArsR/SmtB family transcription factor [Brevibacillus thermoruber]|jgi:DNA-binding transcriptional ArsR family regulator|uniref:Winged helix-turn-helix domain-containing protein n=1 Tax=Brevibacillus thermoruber TaxID=33942 RepID=A0A9X3TQY6_9BACL|nr:winged helix-turn-helix domain-containing protein [Brevibacillus thermoruber]MDA5109076.1 winged helix-turn-helix domain-containing protein [Brevibacillus thermoruber]